MNPAEMAALVSVITESLKVTFPFLKQMSKAVKVAITILAAIGVVIYNYASQGKVMDISMLLTLLIVIFLCNFGYNLAKNLIKKGSSTI